MDSVSAGMVSGDIGRIIFAKSNYDSALTLFKTDYEYSMYDSAYNEAANALQWMAKANLALGNKASALGNSKEALRLLSLWPSRRYLRDTYFTLSQVYRALGDSDSAFYFNDRFIAIMIRWKKK